MSNVIVIIFHKDGDDIEGKIIEALNNRQIKIENEKVIAWENANSIHRGQAISEDKNYRFVMVYDDEWKNLNVEDLNAKEKIKDACKQATQIFVALHSESFMESQKSGLECLFPNICVFAEYSHSVGNIIYENAVRAIEATEDQVFNDALENLIKYFKELFVPKILHLFLPLDIDMQALKILIEQENNKKAAEYLKEMIESNEYHKRILSDAEELKRKIPDEGKRKGVEAMFKDKGEFKIENFLHTLINLEPNKVSKEFFNNVQNEDLKEDIKNFHDWYCDLCKVFGG